MERTALIALAAAAVTLSTTTPALAGGGDPLWVARVGQQSFGATFYDVTVGGDGTVYTTGSLPNPSGESLSWGTAAYAPDGTRNWLNRLESPGLPNGSGVPAAIALDEARGRLYVAGALLTPDGREFGVVAYDPATGQRLWVARTNTPWQYDDAAALAVDPASGTVFVTGDGVREDFETDYLTVAWSPGGVKLWSAVYDTPESLMDHARAIGLDAAGNVYVTGYSVRPFTDEIRSTTLSYSPAGALRWAYRTSSAVTPTRLTDLVVDEQRGQMYAAGTAVQSTSVPLTALLAIDLDGVAQWRTVQPQASADRDPRLALDAATGTVYVAVTGRGPAGDGDIGVRAVDSEGGLLWTRGYARPGSEDVATALTVDTATGDIVVTGTTDGATGLATVLFDGLGGLRWVTEYGSARTALVHANAVTTDSLGERVYVAGGVVETSVNGSAVVVAYDAR